MPASDFSVLGAPCWQDLMTSDIERAKAFYGEVFGWETSAFGMGDAEMTMWHLPGYVGGEPSQPVPRDVVAIMLPPNGAPPNWSVDFWVRDVDDTAARAEELGGSAIVPPFEPMPGFRQAVLADPAGAAFSVTRVSAA